MRSAQDNCERKQEYMAHRARIQNAKSVVNSQPPCNVVKRPRREMSFTEMMNSVRTAIQRKSNTRTFTTAPNSATPSATGTVMTVGTNASNTSPRRSVIKSRMKLCNSERLAANCGHDKSAMLLYDCNSCGAFGCCCTCGGAGDGRHCLSSCADMHEQFRRNGGGQERMMAGGFGAGDGLRVPLCQNMFALHERTAFSGAANGFCANSHSRISDSQVRHNAAHPKRSTVKFKQQQQQQPTAEQRAAYQHQRLSMPLRHFWHRATRKEWNDDTRVPQKPIRIRSELGRAHRVKRSVHTTASTETSNGDGGANASQTDITKPAGIPLHVLKRYQDITVSTDEGMLRRLLRPRVFFDLEVKGIRPLGRIVIQLYTEACPEVVLEFVRMCTAENGERITFTRLFPPLWLEGELALTDNKTLTAHNIEHDTNVLDHGCGAGILSFPSRYVRGSKRRFLSFSISFKPLKVLNGKRIAFGRIKRGFWILDAVQDYGTNSGKPQREIVVTSCGLCN